MSDHDSKFNLGDNSDGYTRSVSSDGSSYSFDTFTQHKKSPRSAGNPPKRQKRPAAPQGRAERPGQPQKKKVQRPSSSSQHPPVRRKELNQRMMQPPVSRNGKKPMPPQRTSRTRSEENNMHTVQRRRQTKTKRLFSYVMIALLVVIVMVVLSLTVLFPINEIEVVGSGYYPNEQVIAASGLELGENIIRCKADQVSDILSKALPYVDHAEVKRSVSGKVTITVTETVGKYAVLYGEQCVILNAQGKVLEIASGENAVKYTVVLNAAVDSPVPGTPAVFSGDISLEKVLSLGNSLADASIDKITSMDLTNISDVIVMYDARLKLQIGTLSGLERKLALAQRVIARENELNPSQYGTVNLTVDGKAYFSETIPDELLGEGVDESVTEPGDENLVG